MKLPPIYRFILYSSILLSFKRFIIADEATEVDTHPTQEPVKTDQPPPSETKVIEIKVNNEVKNSDNQSSGIKIEEIKPSNSDSPSHPKTKDATIATITVNIPNNEQKTIEIKNVEPVEVKSDKEVKKAPVKDQKNPVGDDNDEDTDTSFLHRLFKFISSDFRFLVKFGAILSATLNQMIPLSIILTIRKHRSTRNLKALNFITSAVSALLWSLYGTLTKNIIILVSSFPGALTNTVGIWYFLKYCTDTSQKFIMNISGKIVAVFSVIFLILYFVLSSATFLTVVGLFGGSILAISYVSPLVSFNEILESRNTSTMPTEISLGNFITSFFMFCYGFIIWDLLVIAPSFLGVISGLIQLTLLFLFPHSDRIIISEVEILEQPNNFKSMLTIDQEV